MNILILGSGGREHAFAWKIRQSPLCDKLFIAPGNAGTAAVGENVPLKPIDMYGISKFVLANDIGMVVVGPEDPLVLGIVNYFAMNEKLRHVILIGPKQAGARLEGSKEFAKDFMRRHFIPTAKYGVFTKKNLVEGLFFLRTLPLPIVLKADGLAAGKGVLIVDSYEEAANVLSGMIEKKTFGEAGKTVVVEEFIKGIELSVFILTDGNSYKILPTAKDYKRIGDNDTGLNTGGMGAVSPVFFANKTFMNKVEKRIIIPTIEGLKADGIEYKGFLFIGLMNDGGNPYVIEYNVRMGDPETEAVIPRIKSDLVPLFLAVSEGTLDKVDLKVDKRFTTTVVMVSGGYPGDYQKNKKISGLDQNSDGLVFHSGTVVSGEDVVTNGGRVLAITAFGETPEDARENVYADVEKINFEGMNFRKDIGADLLKMQNKS